MPKRAGTTIPPNANAKKPKRPEDELLSTSARYTTKTVVNSLRAGLSRFSACPGDAYSTPAATEDDFFFIDRRVQAKEEPRIHVDQPWREVWSREFESRLHTYVRATSETAVIFSIIMMEAVSTYTERYPVRIFLPTANLLAKGLGAACGISDLGKLKPVPPLAEMETESEKKARAKRLKVAVTDLQPLTDKQREARSNRHTRKVAQHQDILDMQQVIAESLPTNPWTSTNLKAGVTGQLFNAVAKEMLVNYRLFLLLAPSAHVKRYVRLRYGLKAQVAERVARVVLEDKIADFKHTVARIQEEDADNDDDDEVDGNDVDETVADDLGDEMEEVGFKEDGTEDVDVERQAVQELRALFEQYSLSGVLPRLRTVSEPFNAQRIQDNETRPDESKLPLMKSFRLFPQRKLRMLSLSIDYVAWRSLCPGAKFVPESDADKALYQSCRQAPAHSAEDKALYREFVRAMCPPRELRRLRRLNVGHTAADGAAPYVLPKSVKTNGIVVSFGARVAHQLLDDKELSEFARKRAWRKSYGGHKTIHASRLQCPPIHPECMAEAPPHEYRHHLTRLPERGLFNLNEFHPDVLLERLGDGSGQIRFNAGDPGVDTVIDAITNQGKDLRIERDEWKQLIKEDHFAATKEEFQRTRRGGRREDLNTIFERWKQSSLFTSDKERFQAALAQRLADWDTVFYYTSRRTERVRRFDRFRCRQRAMDTISNRFVGDRNHNPENEHLRPQVMFVGDMATKGTMRGKGSTPTVAIREHCAKKGLTVLLNEHLTSACCSVDGTRMIQGDSYKTFNCPSCKKMWHRDDNAKRNMLAIVVFYIVTGGKRPHYLCRKHTCPV